MIAPSSSILYMLSNDITISIEGWLDTLNMMTTTYESFSTPEKLKGGDTTYIYSISSLHTLIDPNLVYWSYPLVTKYFIIVRHDYRERMY